MLDDVRGHPLEGGAIDDAVLESTGIVVGRIVVREDVDQLVVGPHQREVDQLEVGRLEQSLVEGTREVGAVVVPVVVDEEAVDTVAMRELDVDGRLRRLGLVAIAELGHARLTVPLEARPRRAEQLPLVPTLAEPRCVARVGVPVGKVVRENARSGHVLPC